MKSYWTRESNMNQEKVREFIEFMQKFGKRSIKDPTKFSGKFYSPRYVKWVGYYARILPDFSGDKEAYLKNINNTILERKWGSTAVRGLSGTFLRYLGFTSEELRNLYIPPSKPREIYSKIMTEEEVKKLIENATDPTLRLAIRMLYESAMRKSELLGITIKDIDLENNKVLVLGKGNRREYVYFGEKTNQELKELIDKNPHLPDNLLFSQFTPFTLWFAIKKLVKNVINKNVNVHSFRHTRLTHLAQAGMNQFMIQKIGRHKNISTSEIYINIGDGAVQNAWKQYSKEV